MMRRLISRSLGVRTRPRVAVAVFAFAIGVRHHHRLPLIFPRETGSAALAQNPSSSAESGRFRPGSCFAVWRNERDFLARSVFLFLPTWEFREQLDWALERSRHPAAGFSLSAKQIRRSIPRQPVPRPLAFLQA